MTVCQACGQENPDGFKFCGNCAAALDGAPAPREMRKTVTVVFCDVTGSTALGEQLMAAGDLDAAEQIARRGCELLQEIGERAWLSTQACQLAESLYALGRDDEAIEWVELGLELGASDDVMTQMLARQVLAKLAARSGDHARAEALAAEAVALGESIQYPVAQGDARMDYAEVLAAAGRTDDAIVELERAAALYERKGATACLARARDRLGELAARA